MVKLTGTMIKMVPLFQKFPLTSKPLVSFPLTGAPTHLCIRSRLRRKRGRGSRLKRKDDSTSRRERLKRKDLKPQEAPKLMDRIELFSITFGPLAKVNKIVSSFGIYPSIMGAVASALKYIWDWAHKDYGRNLKKLESFVATFGVHMLLGACIMLIIVGAIIISRNCKEDVKTRGDQNLM